MVSEVLKIAPVTEVEEPDYEDYKQNRSERLYV